jgi:hypothetical protein
MNIFDQMPRSCQGMLLGVLLSACTSRGSEGIASRVPSSVTSARCTENMLELIDDARIQRAEFRAIFSARSNVLHQVLRRTRDRTRSMLQVWNGNPYPVVAIDDWPLAYGWARAAYGGLTPEQGRLLNIDDVWTSLRAELERVQNFPHDIDAMTQKAVDITLQINGIEAYLKKNNGKSHSIELVMPTLVGERVGSVKRYYGTLTKIQIEHRKLKSELARLRQEAMRRGVEHAIGIRRLETYRHELLAARSEFGGAAPPEDYRRILKQIEAFYTDGTAGELLERYQPSDQAWNSVKWAQWRAEVHAFFVRSIPKEKSVQKSKEILEFIKTLNASELRALGLEGVAADVRLVSRARWVRLGVSGATGGSGIGSLVWMGQVARDYFSDGQDCVESDSEEAFYSCLDDYLRRAHPAKYLLKKADLENALVNGDLTDSEIVATVQSMLDRRMVYFVEKNAEAEVGGATRRYLAQMNILSEEFRVRMISETDEKWFRERLLSDDPKTGYLALKFPLIYRQQQVRKIIEGALEAQDFETQKALLVELESMPAAKDLREDLVDLLENRGRYQSQYRQSLQLKEQIQADLFRNLTIIDSAIGDDL